MPELPEVETVRQGLSLYLIDKCIRKVVVRQRRLRYPVSKGLEQKIKGLCIKAIERRAKYLLIRFESGCLIYHLGMSGSLRILDKTSTAGAHDHVDICLDDGRLLRFRDPRKFGSILWTSKDPMKHKLLRDLGPEPLSTNFNGEYLYWMSQGRKLAIKSFLMDSRIVVGIGNIYASEALFKARVHPRRAAGKISHTRYESIVQAVRVTLKNAIKEGGTTLRNFVAEDGRPGYFKRVLNVYQRADQPCLSCKTPIRVMRIAQRSTFYCPRCQR